ncbi:purine-nucleoside phosphorylase [Burkholderia stagnalis]|nr:purine-nucleoside phosphorylase [Burkholderia stagnalis]
MRSKVPHKGATLQTKQKILVSACLLGQPVRYNGAAKTAAHRALDEWRQDGRIVPVCPELAAGFGVPRPPAEIADGASGQQVLAGGARVVETTGKDVTAPYIAGAQVALSLARAHGCGFALLADGSPSCGSRFIYDGSFAGRKHPGAGVTAALLRQHGIEVFAESEIDALRARLAQLD